jgi:hypothetical protein
MRNLLAKSDDDGKDNSDDNSFVEVVKPKQKGTKRKGAKVANGSKQTKGRKGNGDDSEYSSDDSQYMRDLLASSDSDGDGDGTVIE